jgi:tripartite-type tricarboxylate transporter receptor subunit TctC
MTVDRPSLVPNVQSGKLRPLNLPEVISRLQQMGLTPGSMTSSEFAQFQRAEIVKWSSVVKDSGIKVE